MEGMQKPSSPRTLQFIPTLPALRPGQRVTLADGREGAVLADQGATVIVMPLKGAPRQLSVARTALTPGKTVAEMCRETFGDKTVEQIAALVEV